MLHTICEIKCLLANDINTIRQHLSHVLKGRFVAFASLVSLGSAHKSLHIIGLIFKNCGRIGNNAVEIGKLLVTSRSVSIALQRQLARLK